MEITIETQVHAPMATVWAAWVTPESITQWNYAIEEWCCPRATLDLVKGGTFNYRMEARDGSMGFDFEGTFTDIALHQHIHFTLGDDRVVRVTFEETASGVKVSETFEAEDEHSAEQQRQGWQGILDHFKQHVEQRHRSRT
ncbi:SRPBCC family protein [Alcanivorax sediminis]|uniref:ATPase n=1 Tax=Alcanivorax sediminis TaxID=2663008 RepID=A0A6N7LQ06_9GAMM|nr:SRPBCC family protein [Alcanivorax sediminis]MQX52032.1 ATPase [Alcanivorax sediminis]